MRQKDNKRQRLAAALAIILALIMVLGMITPYFSYLVYGVEKLPYSKEQTYTFEEPEILTEGISLEVEAGVDGVCLYDSDNPIEISLKSRDGFSGRLVLEIPIGKGFPDEMKSDFVSYGYDVSLESGGETSFSLRKPLNYQVPVITAKLQNEAGETVFSVNKELKFDQNADYAAFIKETGFVDYFTGLSGRMPFLGGSHMWLMFVAIGAYALILPFLYFILKKRDKRETAWVIIPALSFCAALTVYVLSLNSGYRTSIVNEVNIINEEKESGEAWAFSEVCAISPYSGDILLQTGKTVDFSFGVYRYGSENDGSLRASALLGSPSSAVFYGSKSWDKNSVRYSRQVEPSGLSADADIYGELIKGSILNTGDKSFSDVMLIAGGEVFRIGDFEPGEAYEIFIDLSESSYSYPAPYQVSRDAFPGFEDRWSARKLMDSGEEKEYGAYVKMLRKSLLEGSLNRFLNNYTSGEYRFPLMLVAFTSSGETSDGYYVNGKSAKNFSNDMYVMDMGFELLGKQSYYIPFGFLTPSYITVNSAETEYYDKEYPFFYTLRGGTAEVVFDLLGIGDIKSADVIWETEGKVYAFNHESGQWDAVKGSLGASYVAGGSLRLKTEVEPERDSKIPMIALKGGLS